MAIAIVIDDFALNERGFGCLVEEIWQIWRDSYSENYKSITYIRWLGHLYRYADAFPTIKVTFSKIEWTRRRIQPPTRCGKGPQTNGNQPMERHRDSESTGGGSASQPWFAKCC
ncbi:hypothetical protein TNCV_791011 [Trichonephila clavipes]|nr:hypothetical protein TNCV_791011 [Trichonephila clavipes]